MLDFAGEEFLPRLRPLALADVAGDLGGADLPAGGVEDGRDGEFYVDKSAVLAPAYRFVVIDMLSSPYALQIFPLRFMALRRDQDRNRPADSFRG